MTSVILGHCYTTKNKGDAGIVIATIDSIKEQSPGVRIRGMSTFSSSDEEFIHHHADYQSAGAEMVPALLPEDKLYLFGQTLTSPVAKILSVIKNCYLLAQGYLLYKFNPKWAFGDVGKALRAIGDADVFISKGGSFIYNEGGVRGDISLFKLLLPFWVAKSLGLRTIILGQSLGPFNTTLSKRLFKWFLPSIDRIYLRERRCLRYLDYLDPARYVDKLDDCPDLAFALNSEGYAPILDTDDDMPHIGLTIVNHRFKNLQARQVYIEVLGQTIFYLSERYQGARFHIFPQVLSAAVDGSVDVELSSEVVSFCLERHGIALELIEGDFDARALRETYRRMRFFVATRLHSSIFAATVGVPTIIFGYHGTKAEGIWHDLGFGELFFDINAVDWPQVRTALETIITGEAAISARLIERTELWRKRISKIVGDELALNL
jgi:colanic acid/amylovoran biosynthesis protein